MSSISALAPVESIDEEHHTVNAVMADADFSTIQQLAWHAQIQTTARYHRCGNATKKRGAKLLHVPHRGR
jgi:hypothetical protein